MPLPGCRASRSPSTVRRRFADHGRGEPRRLTVRRHGTEQRLVNPRGQGSTMTDPQPAPLQPPTGADGGAHPHGPAATPAGRHHGGPADGAGRRGRSPPGPGRQGRRLPRARCWRRQPRSPEFAAKATDVRTMGDDDIRQAAETSNRLLKSPVKALQEGGLVRGLQGRLDPARAAHAPSRTSTPRRPPAAKKLLGMIPFGDKVTDYFRKYQSAQSHLDGILHALRDGQDELAQGQRRAQPGEAAPLGRDGPAQPVRLRRRAARRPARRAASPTLEATDPDKAKALREDVLFYVRQKHQDLLTQLAVSIQSYLAIDIVIKNNIELIKGVDRASTTTVSALRTAVIVAQALGNQKLVLDQITALNTTTCGMIERTSRDAARQLGADPGAGGVGDDRAAAAAGRVRRTSTRRWTRSTRSRCRRSTPWPPRSAPWRPRSAKSRAYLDRVERQDQRRGQRIPGPRRFAKRAGR